MKKNKLKLSPSIIIGLLIVLILPACSNRPSWVISPEKMEDVLYDVHLAEAEVDNNYNLFHNSGDNKRQELLDAVFKKHKITEQEFDTSLVWYNGHLEQYFKIYDGVSRRYTSMSDTLQIQITAEAKQKTELNKVNVWKGSSAFLLCPASEFQNTITFRVNSIDWKKGDNFELHFNTWGINQTTHPEVFFYAIGEDTTITSISRIETNGSFSKMISPGQTRIKSLSGFIHVNDSLPNACITIHDFKIYHQKH